MIIHEMYGIQAEELESLRLEYAKVLDLLVRIKGGVVSPEDITIRDNSWELKEQ